MLPYSPLHHLLLSDLGEHARADERERLRRADRLRGRGRPRAGSRRSPTCSCCTTARSRRGRTTPSMRVVGWAPAVPPPLARLRAGLAAAAARLRQAAAGVRRRAEEHVRRGEGRPRVGRAPRRRPEELRDARARSRQGSSTSSGCSPSSPEVVAHDLHPEYLSTKHALELEGVRPIGVQHHHAHLAACLAEHGEARSGGRRRSSTAPATARTARSGAGSCCSAALEDFERVGLLFPVRMPGGDAAVRQPWRMACAWLSRRLRRAAAAAARLARAGEAECLAPGGGARAERASPRRSPRARAGSSTRSPRSAACAPR